MNKFSYGGGICNLEGDVVGLTISYRGALRIKSLVPEGYVIIANDRKILICRYMETENLLTNLFEYDGTLIVDNVRSVGTNGESNQIAVNKNVHIYSSMRSKYTSLTTKYSDLDKAFTNKPYIRRTTVDVTTMDNLFSNDELYFEDGSPYTGHYHLHIYTSKAMTGGTHTEESVDLYILTTSGKLVLTGGN